MAKRKGRKRRPKVLAAWWSEKYAKLGEKVTLNALTAEAAYRILSFRIYGFRRESKTLKVISVPVYYPEVSAKWKAAYKPAAAEYGNPEFRFRAKVNGSGKTSKTLYIPAELEIALTFDDGPALSSANPTTGKLLAILAKNKIKATFFVEHSRIINRYGQEILRKIADEGHEAGIHGVDPEKHHLKHQNTPNFKAKLKEIKKQIKSIIGKDPKLIRPPGGWAGWVKGIHFNKKQLTRIYRVCGAIRYIGAGTDGVDDWGAEAIKPHFWPRVEEKIEKASKGNAQKLIILMHDLQKWDMENLDKIIVGIKDRGDQEKVKVKFLIMSELAGIK